MLYHHKKQRYVHRCTRPRLGAQGERFGVGEFGAKQLPPDVRVEPPQPLQLLATLEEVLLEEPRPRPGDLTEQLMPDPSMRAA